MALQTSFYSFVDGDRPIPNKEISIRYDPARPADGARLGLPAGYHKLTRDHLTELGVLLIAVSGQETTSRVDELLRGFGLEIPAFLQKK